MPASSSCEAASAELDWTSTAASWNWSAASCAASGSSDSTALAQRLDVGEVALERAGQRLVTLSRGFGGLDGVQVVNRGLGQRLEIIHA